VGKVWKLEVEDWDVLSPAARVETTHVQRFGTRHRPINVKIDTGYDPSGKAVWVKEAVVQSPVVVDILGDLGAKLSPELLRQEVGQF
jgi:hypothetical protein